MFLELVFDHASCFFRLVYTSFETFSGRINSKFSPAKLMALNETGIHNVVSLILTLITTTEMTEMVRIN